MESLETTFLDLSTAQNVEVRKSIFSFPHKYFQRHHTKNRSKTGQRKLNANIYRVTQVNNIENNLDKKNIIADINECSVSNGGCSQTCIDLQPDYTRDQTEGFRCLCAAGFLMATDGTTCQGSICYLSFQQKSRHETKFRKLSRDTATTGPLLSTFILIKR